MTVMITPKGAVLAIIAILVIVMLIYIIALIRKLINSLKKLDGVLDDAKKMTQIASGRVEQVDGIVEDVCEVASQAVEAAKGNQGSIAAATNIIGATSSLVGLFRRKRKAESTSKKPKKKKAQKEETKEQ